MQPRPTATPDPTVQAAAPRHLTYRPDVDGLRALAVSSVIGFHAGIPFLQGGFVGVDVFFVISGYLIGSLIYRDVRQNRFSFAEFYSRRARRILPALFATLALSTVMAVLILTPSELVKFSTNSIATVLAVSNVDFWLNTSYFAPSAVMNPLLMTWSLGVEEQFYFIFPFFMIALVKFAPKHTWTAILTLCVVSLAAAIACTTRYPSAAFFLLPMRAWELGAGTCLAIIEADRSAAGKPGTSRWNNILGVTGILLILSAILCFDAKTPFPGFAALVPVSGSAMLLASRGSAVNRILLSARPVVFVGLISYSWYLLHWPLLSFVRLSVDGNVSVGAASIIVLIAFGAAVISWRYVEQPFRRRPMATPPMATPLTLRYYGVATIVTLCFVSALQFHRGWDLRFPAVISDNDGALVAEQLDPCLAAYGMTAPVLNGRCLIKSDGPSVAIIGDSHAAALGGAIRSAAISRGLGFFQATKASCPALAGVTRFMPNHRGHDEECVTHSDSRENLHNGLLALVRKLRDADKHVVVVQDVPIFSFDPMRHVANTSVPARAAISRILGANNEIGGHAAPGHMVINRPDEAAAIIAEVANTVDGVQVLDIPAEFCSTNLCRFADGGTLLYADAQHLTERGAEQAVSRIVFPERKGGRTVPVKH